MSEVNPIVIVTGSNSGVGFGICHRLLVQLASSSPSDCISPDDVSTAPEKKSFVPYTGLTLILACRNVQKADQARTELLHLLETEVARQKTAPGYDGHADVFARGVRIETHYVDLSIMSSVLKFAEWSNTQFPYVSHLICNAGIAPFNGVYGGRALKQMFTSPSTSTTVPQYLRQEMGMTSQDGLGLVWQNNVFGHYALFRNLEPLFAVFSEKSDSPAKIIWMSSSSASGTYYDPEDLQLIKTERPYETSKFQMETIAAHLNTPYPSDLDVGLAAKPRHFVVQPGVLATSLDAVNSKGVAALFRNWTFLLARLLGSVNHPSTPYKAAVSATHAALVALPKSAHKSWIPSSSGPVKIHTLAPFLYDEHVSYVPYTTWTQTDSDLATKLLKNYDTILDSFVNPEGHTEIKED